MKTYEFLFLIRFNKSYEGLVGLRRSSQFPYQELARFKGVRASRFTLISTISTTISTSFPFSLSFYFKSKKERKRRE
jgi:hypothetical protein